MARSFLGLLRGPDGVSLARALACLLLLNALIAGFHSGIAAAAPVGTVLCSADAAGIADTTPGDAAPRDHAAPCCAAGCLSGGVALPPPAETPLRIPTAADRVAAPGLAAPLVAFRADSLGARGPPFVRT